MNFLPELDTETLKNLSVIVCCFFFSLSGSYIKDITNIYKGNQRDVKRHKVIIGTIVGTGIYLILVHKFIDDISVAISVSLNVLCGLMGYEIFSRCGSIEDMKKTSSDIGEILKNISLIDHVLGSLFGSSNKKDKDKKDSDK